MIPLNYDSAKTYYTIMVTTASSRRTICYIHEQCMLLLRQAMNEPDEKRRQLSIKVQNLLSLLERSLRLEDPLAESLLLLYDYCYCQLETTETEQIQNSLSILGTLRTTFDELQTSL